MRPGAARLILVTSILFSAAAAADAASSLSIAIDRDSPSTLFVSVFGSGVLRSFDAGASWRRAGPGLPGGDIREVVSLGGGRWLAAANAGIFRTIDAGELWTRSSIAIVEPAVFDLAVAPSASNVVYAVTAAGGFRSVDGGGSWQPFESRFAGDSLGHLAVDPTTPDRVYCGSYEGLYRSLDGGRSWTRTGFQVFGQTLDGAGDVRIDPNRPSTIYLADLICGLGCATALRKSDDGGDSSVTVLGANRILAIAVDSGSVVIASNGDTLQRSFDRGATWETVGRELPPLVSRLSASESSPLIVAGTNGGQLFASTDHGATWRALSDPAPLCFPFPGQLCLTGRFVVSATVAVPEMPVRAAQPAALTENTAAFWFFSANNLELVVKVVDGRAFNGHFWVFVAGLSDLEYSVSVTDVATGATRVYRNVRGELRSQADTAAF